MNKLANGEFGEFTSMEKYNQLLFNWRIRQSQKLDKPSCHHLNPFVCSLVLKGDQNLFNQFSSSEKQKDPRTYYPKNSNTNPVSGNSYRRGQLSTVDLLVKIACFVKIFVLCKKQLI